jgi:hypothetical protein
MRICQCGSALTQYAMTRNRESWDCHNCGRYQIFDIINTSSVAPHDNHEAIFSCVTPKRELVVQHQSAVESGFLRSSTDC